MALRTRPTQFPELGSGVATEQLTAASRLVSYLTGFAIQPNKAIVGGNAFAHELGIHQDGVIKNPLTYEIMTPQSVGLSGSQLTIGKLSGRRGLQGKLRELGYEIEGEALDDDLPPGGRAGRRQEGGHRRGPPRARSSSARPRCRPRSRSIGWSVTSSHGGNATGSVSLIDRGRGAHRRDDRQRPGQRAVQRGRRRAPAGPRLAPGPDRVRDQGRVSAGEDAQGQVLVRCRRSSDEGPGALVVTGHGLSTNIIEASLEAYLVAVNKLHGAEINGVSVAFVAPRLGEALP